MVALLHQGPVTRWLFLAVLLVVASCSSATDENDSERNSNASGIASNDVTTDDTINNEPVDPGDSQADSVPAEGTDETGGGTGPSATGDSQILFDQDALHTFELTLSEEALAEIDADPTAEQHVEGALHFQGETIEPVGIRYKGSIGAFVGCVSSPDLFNPTGEKTCTKLSMKIKINWDDPDQEFYGQRKLQFHAMNLDPTQLHERLGYSLFREMGVAAPRATHARLVINGEYSGVYALVEQIDSRFTRQNFPDGTGNLYKEAWPFTSNGDVQSDATFIDSLRTNEDDAPTSTLTRTFAEQLANTNNTTRVLDEWMDLEAIVTHLVVDRAIRHDDGPLHWYCFGDECEPHNFYWYEDPSGPKLHLIPWDLDNAFENLVSASNPVTPIADKFGEITNDCEPFASGGFGLTQLSAACDPLFAAIAAETDLWQEIEDDLWNGPLAKETVEAQLDTWVDQISNATAEANSVHNDAASIEQWLQRVETFKESLDYVRTRR